MHQIAGWLAPAATMVAAMMTAANLGARVTGWGFVVFMVGSIGWIVVAVRTGQQNLFWTNGFLAAVNAVGIWRWLGRQAKYEEGSEKAAARSAAAPAPTLTSVNAFPGSKVLGPDGEPMATVVDAMMRCSDTQLAYVVVSEGGVAGVGERLHALSPAELIFSDAGIGCRLSAAALASLPLVTRGAWPTTIETAHGLAR